jgi:hypothetical protein
MKDYLLTDKIAKGQIFLFGKPGYSFFLQSCGEALHKYNVDGATTFGVHSYKGYTDIQ